MTWSTGIITLIGQLAPLVPRWLAAREQDRAAIEAEADAALDEWRTVRDRARATGASADAAADAILDEADRRG